MTEQDTFDEERAVEFLPAFAKSADKDAATRVARMLGCRMLSLAHASACFKQAPQMSFDTYATALDGLIQAAPVVEAQATRSPAPMSDEQRRTAAASTQRRKPRAKR